MNISSSLFGTYGGPRSPFSSVEYTELVPGESAVFLMVLNNPNSGKSEDWTLQTHLDIEEIAGSLTHTIRFRTQRLGCFLKCQFCEASGMPNGKNLEAAQIIAQVAEVLARFDLNKVQHLVLSSKGLGEPLINKATAEAIEELSKLLPEARFTVSSSGPRAGKPVFDALLALAELGVPIDLEFSVHRFDDAERAGLILPLNPKMLWSVQELSDLTAVWKSRTGRSVRFTLAFGPNFVGLKSITRTDCLRYFPPDSAVAQLTLLAPISSSVRWNPWSYMHELRATESMLQNAGYNTVRFLPPGFDQGGSCGTLVQAVQTAELVQIAI